MTTEFFNAFHTGVINYTQGPKTWLANGKEGARRADCVLQILKHYSDKNQRSQVAVRIIALALLQSTGWTLRLRVAEQLLWSGVLGKNMATRMQDLQHLEHSSRVVRACAEELELQLPEAQRTHAFRQVRSILCSPNAQSFNAIAEHLPALEIFALQQPTYPMSSS
jgi:hypothetical protein